MRNCEQLLGSLGLFSYSVETLDLLNDTLSEYGPENCRDYSKVTKRREKGKLLLSVEKQNIDVTCFSGN